MQEQNQSSEVVMPYTSPIQDSEKSEIKIHKGGRDFSIERRIFREIGIHAEEYETNMVEIAPGQAIYTIRVKYTGKNINNSKPPLYMTHGFGGSSLFYYDLVKDLREQSEVVLFDLRGMGLSDKIPITLSTSQQIIKYFVEPIEVLRKHFNHKIISLMGHSFGSYVLMMYAASYGQYVDKLVMFSPIGITPKEEDEKNKVRGCGDCIHYLISQLGWKCELTYKNLLKYFACCCKRASLRKNFKDCGNPPQRIENFTDIVMLLYNQPLCSQRLFFKLFQPRVLPTYDLQHHYQNHPPKHRMKLIYGQTDWVDRKGAKKLVRDYPEFITYWQIQGSDHQIFFNYRQGLHQELIDLILH